MVIKLSFGPCRCFQGGGGVAVDAGTGWGEVMAVRWHVCDGYITGAQTMVTPSPHLKIYENNINITSK